MTRKGGGNDEKEGAGRRRDVVRGVGAGGGEIPAASAGMTRKRGWEDRGMWSGALVLVAARYPRQARV